jgi:hypothetical protein
MLLQGLPCEIAQTHAAESRLQVLLDHATVGMPRAAGKVRRGCNLSLSDQRTGWVVPTDPPASAPSVANFDFLADAAARAALGFDPLPVAACEAFWSRLIDSIGCVATFGVVGG